jgi:hypothetical protein
VPVFVSLLIQLLTVASITFLFGGNIPVRLRILLSATFVTVPVWIFQPLADAGMIFALDIVVPLLLLHEMYVRSFRFEMRGIEIAATLIFLFPLVFAPLSYFFLDPAYYAFHGVVLVNLLFRCLVIVGAISLLIRDLEPEGMRNVCRFMAYQFFGLFVLGSLQYLAGLDLVVYERFKDTEEIVEAQLYGVDKIFYGLGFLGLFRGAVAQMAVIAISWWLLWGRVQVARRSTGLAQVAMYVLAGACVVGSMSRIGLIALILVFTYILVVIRNRSAWILVLSGALCVFLLVAWFPASETLGRFVLLGGRYGLEELSGQIGSGRTRIESVLSLLAAMTQSVWPWVTGLGGFNPIATFEHYGVHGMHGDYLDIVVRYGILLGFAYLGLLLLVFYRQLQGFFSKDNDLRYLARCFGAFTLGVSLLALTQGALLFSGAAGYLAAVHAWLVIAYFTKAQGTDSFPGVSSNG